MYNPIYKQLYKQLYRFSPRIQQLYGPMDSSTGKPLAQWFPHNGCFTQAGRVIQSLGDSSGPRTVRHHMDTVVMAKIVKDLPASHTRDTLYTAAEVAILKTH